MIVWIESGSVTQGVGLVGHEHCATCGSPQQFDVLLYYDYIGLAFLDFGIVTNRSYQAHCQTCGVGTPAPTKDVESALGRVPIPFRRRFGLPLFLLVNVLLISAIFILRPYFRPGLSLPK